MKFFIIDEHVTLEALLAHSSPEVRRHAKGCLAALKRNAEQYANIETSVKKIIEAPAVGSLHQLRVDSYEDTQAHCTGCNWSLVSTGRRTLQEIKEIFNSTQVHNKTRITR